MAQSYKEFEIIVVDDGSTDNTRKVVEKFKDNVIYLYKPNGGPASARNLGISQSKGEFIAFIDADDIWLPEKLSLQINYLLKNPQFGMIHANTLVSEKDWKSYPFFLGKIPKSGRIFKELFLDNFVNNLTVVIRHSCFDAINGFDESQWLIGIEDYDLWLRTALLFEIGYLDKIVAIYRIHGSNLSSDGNRIYSQLLLLEKFQREFQDIGFRYPGLFQEKKDRLIYRWGCWLFENRRFDDALKKFRISARRSYLTIHSILGLIGCFLRTNCLCKNRDEAMHLQRYANYLWVQGDKAIARKYYRMSLKQYALQATVLKRIWGF